MAQYNFSARRKEEKKSGIMGMKRIEEGSRGEVRKPPNYKEAHKAEKLMARKQLNKRLWGAFLSKELTTRKELVDFAKEQL